MAITQVSQTAVQAATLPTLKESTQIEHTANSVNTMVLNLLKDCQALCFLLQSTESRDNHLARDQIEQANILKGRCLIAQALFIGIGVSALTPIEKETKEGLSTLGNCLSALAKSKETEADGSCRKAELCSSTLTENKRNLQAAIDKLTNVIQGILQKDR